MVSINKLRGELIMNKKGAVELSMTTIIIIVIGITVLSLGLVWIRGVFQDVGDITESAFEEGGSQIDEILGGSDEPVAISPSGISIEQGDSENVGLIINNLESGSITIDSKVIKIGLGKDTSGLSCLFADSEEAGETSESYSLESGYSLEIPVYVGTSKSLAIGDYSCKFTVSGLGTGEQSVNLFIEIE
jgi:hypothetical protein